MTIPVQNRHTLDFESYKVFNPTGSSRDINFDYFKAKGTLNLDTIKSLDQQQKIRRSYHRRVQFQKQASIKISGESSFSGAVDQLHKYLHMT